MEYHYEYSTCNSEMKKAPPKRVMPRRKPTEKITQSAAEKDSNSTPLANTQRVAAAASANQRPLGRHARV